MIILIVLCSICCILLCFLYYIQYYENYWKKRNIVQVNRGISQFLLGKCALSEVYKDIYDKYPNEPCVGLMRGFRPALLLKNLDNVQAVLAGNFGSFYSRGIPTNPDDVLADNLLFIEDFARWKLIRQKLSPVFTSSKLKNMFYVIEKCARDFTELVRENKNLTQRPFDALSLFTTASLGSSVFGIDTKTKNTMTSPFLDMMFKTTYPTFVKNFKVYLANTFPRLFIIFNLKNFGHYQKFFIGFIKKALKTRITECTKRHDFIDTCVELQSQGVMKENSTSYRLEPSDELLAAQAFFFFVAGSDTSANVLNFTLLELSKNQSVLLKVHQEIDVIFGECNENITYDVVVKMKYLDMVISEAMRKFPPIGVIQRRCTKDTYLPVGNVKVEKNTLILIPIYAIHRDKSYYDNPDVFDPERFSYRDKMKIKSYSYLPFGEGNRSCIGARYARVQVKTCLAWLLRRFTLQEHSYQLRRFAPSFFSLRAPDAKYKIIPKISD